MQIIACVSLISPNNTLSVKMNVFYAIELVFSFLHTKIKMTHEHGWLFTGHQFEICTCFKILHILLIIKCMLCHQVEIVNGGIAFLKTYNLVAKCMKSV